MPGKEDIINEAYHLGFADIGFTSAEPFDKQREILLEREDFYDWVYKINLDLLQGTDPRAVYPEAKSIIVLIYNYFQQAFPPDMAGKFGRCYMNDDRMIKDGLAKMTKDFRRFLTTGGINSKSGANLPQRLAAARAGLGTFGKNCLFYSRKAAGKGSWVFPIVLLVDREFTPDEATIKVECPDWCKNACIAACPTGALRGPNKIDPRRCISYLSYYGDDDALKEYREEMGVKVYGCDRCQEVCPRNEGWMARELPPDEKIAEWSQYFDLAALLHMDEEYYIKYVQPHMFYIPPEEIWRFQMNAARAMGNSLDFEYYADLTQCLAENQDERVREMAAWALKKLDYQMQTHNRK